MNGVAMYQPDFYFFYIEIKNTGCHKIILLHYKYRNDAVSEQRQIKTSGFTIKESRKTTKPFKSTDAHFLRQRLDLSTD